MLNVAHSFGHLNTPGSVGLFKKIHITNDLI